MTTQYGGYAQLATFFGRQGWCEAHSGFDRLGERAKGRRNPHSLDIRY